jgi:hypothetical protein
LPDESFQRPIEPLAEQSPQQTIPQTEPAPETKPEPVATGLKSQLDSMRQQAQPDPIDAYISHYFAGALPNERQWLRANQHHLQNPMLVHQAAQIALQRGVPRESPEFLHFVGQLLNQHHAAMQAPAAPPVPPPPEPAHAAHVDIETEHEPDEEPPMPQHFSAPVSRGEHGHAIEPEPTMGTIRLSPEQRDIAARSGISDVEYAKQLLRMQKMKTSGLIK